MSKRQRPPRRSEQAGPPSEPVNPLSWITVVVLCGMLLWSARTVFDYAELFDKLCGKSLVERGRVGSDEWSSFLARAGRPPLQQTFAAAKRRGIVDQQRSEVAYAWAAIVNAEHTLPPNAKIYLNVPSILLYYYGTTLWYPRPVDANTRPVMIKGGDTLLRESVAVDPGQFAELRRLGYTHIITSDGIRPLSADGSRGGGQQ